jgi:predicted RNA binding protein with dsRBD fold (UPF0201 family)
MQLELTTEDTEVLQEALDSVVRDLSLEIADTDNAEFRRGLQARRDRLQALLDQVGGPLARTQ